MDAKLKCTDCGSREFKIYNEQRGVLTCEDCGQILSLKITPSNKTQSAIYFPPEVPCHKTLGHGETCSVGHLCDSCRYIIKTSNQQQTDA